MLPIVDKPIIQYVVEAERANQEVFKELEKNNLVVKYPTHLLPGDHWVDQLWN